ncbi:MAG: gliding motility-associated C-terminal domain-containing protein [Bacteroidales bacterium]
MQKWLSIVFIGLAFLLFEPLYAQKEGAIWYFGQNAGLDFNQYYPRPLTDGQINTREGVATICDKDGGLLFYTDGQTVYDRSHKIMDNGEGLYGDKSSTQSSIVVPRPGSTTQYYLFTVDQAGTHSNPGDGIKFSVVDITGNGGLGSVIQKNAPMPNVSGIRFTEKITVVKHFDKESYWVIAHEFGTDNFYEFLLTNLTLTFKDAIPAGAIHRIDPGDRDNRGATGYLKSSPKGDYLATAVEGLFLFELFHFDNKTGDIRLLATLPAGTSADPVSPASAAYGVEFSPTSNYLYGSSRKDGYIYQWDLSYTDPRLILNSVQILRPKSNILCGALQLGLNGKIYVCLSGQPYLGVINSPIQKNCNYTEHGTSLVDNSSDTIKGGTAYFGLPTFLSDFFKAAEFYYENTCQNDLTIFYVSANRSTLGSLPTWDIYDANNVFVGKANVDAQTYQGTYRFPKAGKYFVKFYVYQAGDVYQTQEVTIHSLPELNLPDTTSMCKGSPAHLDAGDGAFYSWRDKPNLNVERYRDIYNAGKYVVTVTHYNGCSNTDSTFVVAKPLPVIRDTLMALATCGVANGSIILDMQEGDQYSFAWTRYPDSTASSIHNLAAGVYEVNITSANTGCVLTSKITISEKDAPVIKIQPSVADTICPGQSITLTAEGAQKFRWENIAGNDSAQTINIQPQKTTTYFVEGYSIDQSGKKCSGFGEITIQVFPSNPPQLGSDREGCQNGIPVILDGGAEYLSWNWKSIVPPLNDTSRLLNITQTYQRLELVVTDKNGCEFSDDIKVIVKPLPVINLGSDSIIMCKGTPIKLYGGTGDSLLWSTGERTDNIWVDTTDTYRLSIWKNGCANTDSVYVEIKPLPDISLNLPREATNCLTDSLELFGGRGDSYLWSTGDTLRNLYVKQTGTYWLKIFLDGCSNSDTVNLTLNPLPKVDLGTDTVLCKSSPFRLTGDDGQADSYLWSNQATTPDLLVSQTGTYSLTVGSKGCFNSDTVMIRVNDPAMLVIEAVTVTQVTCPGNRDGSLLVEAHGSGTSWEYSIDDGLTYSINPFFQGLYGKDTLKVMVREDKACTVKYNQPITFNEPDSIHINYHLVSPSCETCPDGEINLSIKGGTPPYSVKWSTNDTLTFLSNMVLGKYLVWVTDANKCRENILIDLTLDFPPFQIPNAFTPNGDGINEKWEIAALNDFPDCEVKVFNRAGQMVWFSDTGYTVPWEGTDKSGAMLPVGSYYYLVWLQSDLKPLKGSVSILR